MLKNNLNTKTDEELVDLSLKNPEIYLFLMQRYENKLLHYIQNISLVSLEDAQDILQESFIKAYRNLNDFDSDLKFSSWIFRIVRNETISHFRRFKNKPQFKTSLKSDELLNLVADENNPAKLLESKNKIKDINQILDHLDQKYREVLILKYIEGKNYTEISDILKKSPNTVGTLIHRAKKVFKNKIEELKINL